jgi:glucan 1,3-beta-glucosidase
MNQLLKHDVDQACKTQADYEADFDALKPYTSIVRTYSAVDGAVPENPCQVAQQILPAAATKGIKVILGMWYDDYPALDAFCLF